MLPITTLSTANTAIASLPATSLAAAGGGSSFVKSAAETAEQNWWNSISQTSPIVAGHRFSVAAPKQAFESVEPGTGMDEAGMQVMAPSFAFLAAMLLISSAISIASIFAFLRRGKSGKAEQIDPRERETVPLADSELPNPDRPTVAATPTALEGKNPSFGVKVGWENIPGASIMPPPGPGHNRGGRGIE